MDSDRLIESVLRECPWLSGAEIASCKASGDMESIMLHCYRLATHVAVKMKGKSPIEGADEDYWEDAIQECMLKVPNLIAKYRTRKPGDHINKYLVTAFSRCITRYIWKQLKGGMGSDRAPIRLFSANLDAELDDPDEDNEFSADALEYDCIPQGLRDPLDEAIAAQEVARADRRLRENQRKKFGQSKRHRFQGLGFCPEQELGAEFILSYRAS